MKEKRKGQIKVRESEKGKNRKGIYRRGDRRGIKRGDRRGSYMLIHAYRP